MSRSTTGGAIGDERGRRPLLTFIGLLVVCAALAYGAVVRWAGTGGVGLAFLGLAALFALSEVFVVHFDFRRNSHTFSLVEVPLVLGLLYATPGRLVPAHLVGAGAALVLHRRQPAVKLVFNLSSLAVQDCVAIVVFGWIADGAVEARSTWLAVVAGCGVGSLVGVGLVFAVMGLSGDLPARSERAYSVAFGLVATLITASTAMAMAVLGELDRTAALLLALPVAGIYLAHRSYVATRQERHHVELLHDSTRLLVTPRAPEEVLDELLLHARASFGVEAAALVCTDADAIVTTARVTAAGADATVRTSEPIATWREFATLLPDGGTRILGAPRRDGGPPRVLAGVIVRDGMVVALDDDDRLVGYLLVANRLGDVGHFGAEDLRVLHTLGRYMVAALAGEAPDISLHELRVLEGEFRYRTRHDELTGLANFDALRDQLAGQLVGVSPGGAGVLMVDVDGIEAAGDELGPDAVDKIIVVVAQRIRSCVREDDMAARIEGRRFAVAARTPGGASDARVLAERVGVVVRTPLNIDGAPVALDAIVGASLGAPGTDADSVLLAAELALIAAAAHGPGGVEIVNP